MIKPLLQYYMKMFFIVYLAFFSVSVSVAKHFGIPRGIIDLGWIGSLGALNIFFTTRLIEKIYIDTAKIKAVSQVLGLGNPLQSLLRLLAGVSLLSLAGLLSTILYYNGRITAEIMRLGASAIIASSIILLIIAASIISTKRRIKQVTTLVQTLLPELINEHGDERSGD